MSGIWAIFGAKEDVKQLCIQCMKVSHRGPDAFRIESIPAFPRSCLGFHRLVVVDPTFGIQSMAVSTYPHLRLLYNGQIYNCRDLGRQYDFRYQTHSDGEVILHLYARFGAKVTAEMLDGVFAFCIVDTKARKVYLGRDIFGVCPLFTFLDTGK